MTIFTPVCSVFSDTFLENNYSFKAALEMLKIQKNTILKQQLLFLDLNSENLKNLFNLAAKDMFFLKVEESWNKRCLGHEYKIDSNIRKKNKAKEKAHNTEEAYKNNPQIIPASVWSEVRGHNDPFVHFKYIDDCSDCDCKTIHTRDVKKINISEVLSKTEKDALLAEMSLETFYASILNYIFQNSEEMQL